MHLLQYYRKNSENRIFRLINISRKSGMLHIPFYMSKKYRANERMDYPSNTCASYMVSSGCSDVLIQRELHEVD